MVYISKHLIIYGQKRVAVIVNSRAIIKVKYNTKGIVEICNTSAETYNGMKIEIYNMANEIVYTKHVEDILVFDGDIVVLMERK